MDLLFELLFELIFEGSIEASKSKKVPKVIRYFLIFLIISIYIFIIGFLLFIGIAGLSKNLIASIVLILFGIILSVLCIIKFKKIYVIKKQD